MLGNNYVAGTRNFRRQGVYSPITNVGATIPTLLELIIGCLGVLVSDALKSRVFGGEIGLVAAHNPLASQIALLYYGII